MLQLPLESLYAQMFARQAQAANAPVARLTSNAPDISNLVRFINPVVVPKAKTPKTSGEKPAQETDEVSKLKERVAELEKALAERGEKKQDKKVGTISKDAIAGSVEEAVKRITNMLAPMSNEKPPVAPDKVEPAPSAMTATPQAEAQNVKPSPYEKIMDLSKNLGMIPKAVTMPGSSTQTNPNVPTTEQDATPILLDAGVDIRTPEGSKILQLASSGKLSKEELSNLMRYARTLPQSDRNSILSIISDVLA